MDDSERVIEELRECPTVDGATMLSILELPDPLRSTLKDMLRGRIATAVEICESLDVQGEAATKVIDLLVEKGYVQPANSTADEPAYCVVLAPIRGRSIADDL